MEDTILNGTGEQNLPKSQASDISEQQGSGEKYYKPQ